MTDWYEFACPDCRCSFGVDAPLRTELLAQGCLWCGASLTRAAFTPTDEPADAY